MCFEMSVSFYIRDSYSCFQEAEAESSDSAEGEQCEETHEARCYSQGALSGTTRGEKENSTGELV